MSMIGKTLGNFQCTALLGKGGMGEVYQAKDQKLGRDVAIKVLPEEFAKDSDRVARFQREAKLLASLNHPNIAAIYGLEESDGTHFLVLELIEGDALASLIKGGPIPVEEALKLALQIAEALEAAHEKGVIHRDLKPANIKVTPDGKVKVLDFGLAKVFAGEQAEVNLSHSPTLSEAVTMQGVILGTAAYMSPEQARGKPVDKRTDIWAFGCVLYEMLTGKAAFQGEDVTEILAAVVKSSVNMDLLPANIHARISEVLYRCLQKEQKKRYSGIGDVQYEIEKVLVDPGGVLVQSSPTGEVRTELRKMLPWFAMAIVLAAIIVGIAVWKLKPTPLPLSPKVVRFDHELPVNQQLHQYGDGTVPLAVSPDGRQFAYSTTEGIYIRSLDELHARLIPGSEADSRALCFSHDGQWIGYFSSTDTKLKKISVDGGTPVALCDGRLVIDAYWYADDSIVYSNMSREIYRVSAINGKPELLIEKGGRNARLLPDGKAVMFVDTASQPLKTVVQSLETEKRTEVFEGSAMYLPTGHLVYAEEGNLFAVPFDLDRLESKGGAIPMNESGMSFAISDSGTLVYISEAAIAAAPEPKRTLLWVDQNGKEEPLASEPQNYTNPRISPDGKKVALSILNAGNRDIYILDLDYTNPQKLTTHKALDFAPLWTGDGKRICFTSIGRQGLSGIYWRAVDRIGKDELLASSEDQIIMPASWAENENTMIIGIANQTDSNIGTMSMEGDHKWASLFKENYLENQPRISPDGRWLAYTSAESGQNEVFVRSFPNINEDKRQVSTSGGNSPLWSQDGRELFYRCDDRVMAVSVDMDPDSRHEKPRTLFKEKYVSAVFQWNNLDFHTWDIHPDGKRFLMIRQSETTEQGPRKIAVVVNWFEELKERVSVD